MEDAVPFGSRAYIACFALLIGGRGADFFSTWLATPNLLLEANPIAKKLGWRWGIPVNFALCVGFAHYPLPAIIITTTSALVASRNLQHAWLMRSMGEEAYRAWMGERLAEAPRGLFVLCLLGQVALTGAVGGALMFFSTGDIGVLGIGMGILGYALAVLVFTLISMWRRQRAAG